MHFFAVWTLVSAFLVGGAYSKSLEPVEAELENSPSNRIIGGVPALPGEFPSMTAVLYYGALQCGGSLIGPYHVLTAANCLSFFFAANPISQLKIRMINTVSLGIAAGSTSAVESTVSKYILHEKFQFDTKDNDIAIVVLNSPITNSAFYAKLPTVFNSYANQLAAIVGWGPTSPGGVLSDTLMKASVTIQDDAICVKQYSTKFKSGNQLCASAPGKDACQGDIGGPILVNGVQVGIASYGQACASPNYAGVYTRLTTYLTWIKTTVTSNPGPASG